MTRSFSFGARIRDDSLDMKVDLATLKALTALFLTLLKDCQADGEAIGTWLYDKVDNVQKECATVTCTFVKFTCCN